MSIAVRLTVSRVHLHQHRSSIVGFLVLLYSLFSSNVKLFSTTLMNQYFVLLAR